MPRPPPSLPLLLARVTFAWALVLLAAVGASAIVGAVLSCSALPAIVQAVGPVVSAVEAVVGALKAANVPPSDPVYVQALAQARAIDDARALRDKAWAASAAADRAQIATLQAQERAEAGELAQILAAVRARGCPAAVLADAGTLPLPTSPQAALPWDGGR